MKCDTYDSKNKELNPSNKVEADDMAQSPFAPPDAYDPPQIDEQIPYDDMHPILQKFMDEHEDYDSILKDFEETLIMMESGKVDRSIDGRLQKFYSYIDDKVLTHNKEEEKTIFPIISKAMNKTGDHAQGGNYFNAIDVLEDEHVKILQLSAITFNLFAVFSRIPDATSRIIVLDAAILQAKELVELLRVHIYREDTIIFNYAQREVSNKKITKAFKALNKGKNNGN